MIHVLRIASLLAILSAGSCISTSHPGLREAVDRSPPCFQDQENQANGTNWSVAHTPVPGGGDGWQVRPFASLNEFDVDIRNSATLPPSLVSVRFQDNVKMRLVGLEGSVDVGPAVLSCVLAAPDFEDDRSPGPDTDNGAYFAMRASLPLLSIDKWILGSSIELGALSSDVTSSSTASSDLTALFADVSLNAAYTASPDALAALSPYGGIGLRVLDGLQDFGALGHIEFDAALAYAFVGIALNWQPTEDLGLSLESHVLVGQINGFQLSFVASF
jgi:hypothetical protein